MAIAGELRKGHPSELFCRMLAGMIDPRGKNATKHVLKLQRKNTGRPKADKRLAYLMERLVDQDGHSIDAAIYEVQRALGRKGHARATCLAALTAGREARGLERDFDAYLARKAAAEGTTSPE